MISNKTTVDEDGEEIVTYLRESCDFTPSGFSYDAVYMRIMVQVLRMLFLQICVKTATTSSHDMNTPSR